MAKSFKINSDDTLADGLEWVKAQYKEHGYLKLSASCGKRGLDKNALSHVWYGQIAVFRQDVTPAYVKNECKAHYGVPILLAENEAFAASYNKLVRYSGASYEEKLEFMTFLDVTSIMTEVQMTNYLNQMQIAWRDKGLFLEGKS